MEVATGTAEVVVDPARPRSATLLVNGVPSSYVDLDDPGRLDFEYMQQMAAVVDALVDQDDAGATAAPGPDVVHLGAGACALARAVGHRHPAARQVAVELDGRLAELVRAWFALPRAPRLRIREGDARTVLAGMRTASADVVVRDVFAGDRTPEHVTTAGFVADVARVLRPGGVYLANCADRPPLALARAEAATVATAFTHVALVAEPAQLRGRRYGNIVLVGTDDPGLLDDAGLARTLRTLPVPARMLAGAELAAFVADAPVREDPADPPTAGASET